MNQVVDEAKIDWLETPDQALVWSVALGLQHDAENVLERSRDDLQGGRVVDHPVSPALVRDSRASPAAARPPVAGRSSRRRPCPTSAGCSASSARSATRRRRRAVAGGLRWRRFGRRWRRRGRRLLAPLAYTPGHGRRSRRMDEFFEKLNAGDREGAVALMDERTEMRVHVGDSVQTLRGVERVGGWFLRSEQGLKMIPATPATWATPTRRTSSSSDPGWSRSISTQRSGSRPARSPRSTSPGAEAERRRVSPTSHAGRPGGSDPLPQRGSG